MDSLNKDTVAKWSRRGFVGALFSGAAVSLLAKIRGNPDYLQNFLGDLGDDVLFKPEKRDFSSFLQQVRNGQLKGLVVSEREMLVTDHENKQTLVGISNSQLVVDMLRDGSIDPKAVNVSFDSSLPFLKDRIDPSAIGKTFLSYWEIPVVAFTANAALDAVKDIKGEADFRRNEAAFHSRMAQRPPAQIRTIAYHEAGHALVKVLRPGLTDLSEASIVPNYRTGNLGVVHGVYPDPPREVTKQTMYNEILSSFAGRAAEEIEGGGADTYGTGYHRDLYDAQRLAEDMIRYGMTEELGPIGYSFPLPDGQKAFSGGLGERFRLFVGRSKGESEVHSPTPELLVRMEVARERILKDAMRDTKTLLAENRDMLDVIAAELLVHKNLSALQVRDIIDRVRLARGPQSQPEEPAA